jgi:hypothetical protein
MLYGNDFYGVLECNYTLAAVHVATLLLGPTFWRGTVAEKLHLPVLREWSECRLRGCPVSGRRPAAVVQGSSTRGCCSSGHAAHAQGRQQLPGLCMPVLCSLVRHVLTWRACSCRATAPPLAPPHTTTQR